MGFMWFFREAINSKREISGYEKEFDKIRDKNQYDWINALKMK